MNYPSVPSKVAAMQKRSLGEVTSPESVDTLRPQESCPQCGDEDFDGKECNVCEYVRPPEELQDPDTMKSRVLQIVRKDPGSNGKEGMHMGTTPTDSKLKAALARKRLAEAQRRLADADMTTDQARESDSTDVTNIDQQFTSEEEARKPDSTTDVTSLPDYKNASVVARNRAAYLQQKRADFGQDDPTQQAGAGQGADPQAAAPSDSDGPNSGGPDSDTPGESGIDGLPIDWKQDESGQPYGTIQGTDLDIFVNEDMSWQVLPEGSNDPVAQGQGSSYDDSVQQAFQQGQAINSQDPSQGDPSADPSAAPADPTGGGDPSANPATPPAVDPTKVSRRKRAQGETPDGAEPDSRTDVSDLPDYETITTDKSQYDAADYDHNSFDQHNKPVDGSDVQNFAPGGKPFTDNNKSASRVSYAKVQSLLETYSNLGLVGNSKQARVAAVTQIEKLHPTIVDDRIATLSLVESVLAKAAANRPRNVVPQRSANSKLPQMGRAASSTQSGSDLDLVMNLK